MKDDDLTTHLINLPQGQIKGVTRQSVYDEEYYSFEGIPYAKPPLGALRFKAPVPADPWTGVLDCTHLFTTKPMQKNLQTQDIDGSEDCLYLNVYTKKLKSIKPLPVIVWIFGGGFRTGEATQMKFAPDYFMAKDVVLVCINYRLCSLGFLSLQDPSLDVPGNAGLKDQVLALKWIKQYIEHFNGDANNITVFGVSAGGGSVHYLTSIEQAKGLFHKAMVMSGTMLNPWSHMKTTDFAYRLAKHQGYQGDNIDEPVLNFLRSLDAQKLVDHNLLTNEDRRNDLMFSFGPTVEPYVTTDCAIPKEPLEMLSTAWGNEIPMIIGGSSFEGLLMYPHLKPNLSKIALINSDPASLVPYEVRAQHSDEENKKLGEALIKLHFGEKKPSAETLMEFLDYYSYQVFWHGTHRTILSRLNLAKAPTYFYRFDFDSPDFCFQRKKYCGDDLKTGVAHAEEVGYLFYSALSYKLDKSSAEYKTIERMIGMWTAFAKETNPNCIEIEPITWSPMQTSEPHKVLNISHELEIIDLPEYEKLTSWNQLYKRSKLY